MSKFDKNNNVANKDNRKIAKDRMYDILNMMYLLCPMYKEDLFFYMADRVNASREYEKIGAYIKRHTKKDAFIEWDVPTQSGVGNRKVVTLSEDAKRLYLFRDKSARVLPEMSEYSEETRLTRLYPHLNTSRSVMMFKMCGVRVFKYDKPSLYFLVKKLAPELLMTNIYRMDEYGNRVTEKKMLGMDTDGYMDSTLENMSNEDLLSTINFKRGIYYTKDEVLKYMSIFDKNYLDSAKGVSWSGLYINDSTVMVVFTTAKGNADRLRVHFYAISSLVDKLNTKVSPITNVNREIKCFSNGESKCMNSISALVIGNGVSHTFSEATGNSVGKVKGNNDMVKGKIAHNREGAKPRFDMLDCTSITFDRIYSIDDSASGIRQLRYITSHSIEDYYEEQKLLFDNNSAFIPGSNNALYPYTYSTPIDRYKASAIYMPVYDIKLLYKLHVRSLTELIKDKHGNVRKDEYDKPLVSSGLPIVIVTYRKMAEVIAHSIRADFVKDKNGTDVYALRFALIDENTGMIENEEVSVGNKTVTMPKFLKPLSGTYLLYTPKGYATGKKMVCDAYARKGLQMTTEVQYKRFACKATDIITEKGWFKAFSKDDESKYLPSERTNRLYNAIAIKNDEVWLSELVDMVGDMDLPKHVSKERKTYAKTNRHVTAAITSKQKRELSAVSEKLKISNSALVNNMMRYVTSEAEKLAEERGIPLHKAIDEMLDTKSWQKYNWKKKNTPKGVELGYADDE